MGRGRIESSEEVRDGLVREVEEESGLSVAPVHLMGAFDGFPVIKGEKCHVVRLYFLCEATTDEVVLSKDHDEFLWIEPQNSGDLVLMDDIAEMLKAVATLISGVS